MCSCLPQVLPRQAPWSRVRSHPREPCSARLPQRPACDPGLLPRRPLSETDDLLALAHLLDEGAPLPAVRATPEPLGLRVSAVGADVKCFRSHRSIVRDGARSTAMKRIKVNR